MTTLSRPDIRPTGRPVAAGVPRANPVVAALPAHLLIRDLHARRLPTPGGRIGG